MLTCVLGIVPWTARNYAAFGQLVPVKSNFGLEFWLGNNPDVKIIFVSGYAEDAFAKSLPEGQQFNFLPKPFTLSQLVGAVKETMNIS